jgi:hypothetical protein
MVLFYSYVNVYQRVVGSWANTPAHWFPLAAYEKLAINWWMFALTVRGAYLGRDGPLSAGIIDHLEGKKVPEPHPNGKGSKYHSIDQTIGQSGPQSNSPLSVTVVRQFGAFRPRLCESDSVMNVHGQE